MRAAKTATGIRREQIAEAALALLGTGHGVQPSIAGIARRVGVVPSAVYRHYRGKEAILAAALDLLAGRLQASIALARQDTGDPLTQLHGLFLRHAALLDANPGAPQVLLVRGLFGSSKARRQKVTQVMQGYLDAVAQIASEGQQLGHIRGDLEPQSAALVFIGMLLPAVIMRQFGTGAFDVAAHARKVWPVLEAAMKAARGGAPKRRVTAIRGAGQAGAGRSAGKHGKDTPA
jgi:AcrR family transcriptional regulator